MTLECVPEWCEHEDGPGTHDKTCPEHPWPLTKAGFVDAAATSARIAVDSYRVLLGEEMSDEERLETVVEEAEEVAVCYVGIGSCGRGWCKH